MAGQGLMGKGKIWRFAAQLHPIAKGREEHRAQQRRPPRPSEARAPVWGCQAVVVGDLVGQDDTNE
jgi:hypothetical protein